MERSLPWLRHARTEAASGALGGALPFVFACAVLVGWATLMTATHSAQFADSIEQYNWSHSLEWGYWKHPPLTTWLMAGGVWLFGAWPWTAPLLSAACLVATAWFVWSLARMLLGERAAQIAIVLWPLHQGIAGRAEVFNHNRTLLLLSAAMAWAGVRAARSARTRDWVVLGLIAGLGMLAKYQAAVTLIGITVAFALGGTLRAPGTARRCVIAAAVAAGVFLPHFIWAARHSFLPLLYLHESSPILDPSQRLPALASFAGVQLGMLAATLVAALAAYAFSGRGSIPRRWDEGERAAIGPWLFGLVAVPLIVLGAMVLFAGNKPQKMWGVHTLMFLPLWLAWHLDRLRPSAQTVPRLALAALCVTAMSAGWFTFEASRSHTRKQNSADELLPAMDLARATLADWSKVTRCTLRVVKGDPFPAGVVSVYSGTNVPVLEDGDFEKTPWLSAEDVARWGTIDIHGPVERRFVPAGVSFMQVPAPAKFAGPAAVWWHITPPEDECGPAAP